MYIIDNVLYLTEECMYICMYKCMVTGMAVMIVSSRQPPEDRHHQATPATKIEPVHHPPSQHIHVYTQTHVYTHAHVYTDRHTQRHMHREGDTHYIQQHSSHHITSHHTTPHHTTPHQQANNHSPTVQNPSI
jgi:hypothetical protein